MCWLPHHCLPRPKSPHPTRAESIQGEVMDERLDIILSLGFNIISDMQWLMRIWTVLADGFVGADVPPSVQRPV